MYAWAHAPSAKSPLTHTHRPRYHYPVLEQQIALIIVMFDGMQSSGLLPNTDDLEEARELGSPQHTCESEERLVL